jgi:uracil phosphoribosyltransferase
MAKLLTIGHRCEHQGHSLKRSFAYDFLKHKKKMQVINFAEQNSIINHYMAELRDKNYQKNRITFRHNVERIGEMMAFELSKTLEYKPKTVKTPLGQLDIPLTKQEDIVVATVLRAGLPFHQGFLNVFDGADNAFVSAYRMYINREHTEVGVHAEYIATPSVKGKTLIIVDPMLATGGSLAAAIEALMEAGKPKKIHVCCVIAAPEGIEVVKEALPEDSTIWCAAIDEGMNEQKYIIPGFGDCGDLCFGEKLQSFRKIADKETKKKGL